MKNFLNKAQDKISCLTHFIGALAGIVYFIILGFLSFIHQRDFEIQIGLLVFSLATIALYSASSFYHYIQDDSPRKQKFRKLDHAMIYVLIAGSYTPICVTFFQGDSKILFPVILWAVALLGVATKVLWINTPRIFSTILYLGLGWSILFDIPSLMTIPPLTALGVILGGASYSIGALIYMIKKPNLSKDWGFHELFHLFILLGTFLHFITYALTIA